ncbi:MAG: tyrosine-protein phosphatase [Nocardioidaceae bacterium]|nr:tyrosine-protein phosphatase [Nocardioidaceae bacterium]MCL2612572.1 tyrosine-protein phosphatase [Nocardioidaceae bacterium]
MSEQTSDGTDLLRLASVDNFRDVAGRGYAGADGRPVATGVFYRSNELRLSGEDLAAASALGLTGIIDLRSDAEIERHRDPDVPGAPWRHFDVIGIPMEQVAGLRTHEAAVELMDRVYRGFVESEHCRSAFAGVLDALAEGGPQLFHCTAGKDRTGWVAALLLHVAGVDDATIERDYLLTNTRSEASRTRTEQEIAAHLGQQAVEVFEPTLVADAEYLQAAYTSVERLYGDRDSYLRDGLGLGEATLERLRSHLLQTPLPD